MMTKRVRSDDGTIIAFDQLGEGPAVILVGGAFQYRAIDPRTARLAEMLSEHFTVFHYDRRGRGESGDTTPYTVEREIEDLAALITEAGGSASVFGMSSGAALALEAARGTLAITKLALYEPPFVVDTSLTALPGDYMTQLTRLISLGQRGEAVEYFLISAVGVPAEIVAQMRQAPFWPAFEAVAHTLAYDSAIMGDGSLATRQFASVTIPTLVIDGEASPESMYRATQVLASLLPNAQRRRLPEQAHDVAPEVLAPVLEAFFAGENDS